MMVTRSGLHCAHYHRAPERYLKEQGYDYGAFGAFSGTVRDGEIEHTDANLNGIPERQTKDTFERAENRFLVVANEAGDIQTALLLQMDTCLYLAILTYLTTIGASVPVVSTQYVVIWVTCECRCCHGQQSEKH